MDRTTLPSDSGYGGSDMHGKMAGKGRFDQHQLDTNLNSTNELFLPPMSGPWYNDYREDYAQSSVFSGNEHLPDPLRSPLDYTIDQAMAQQYDDSEALMGTGAMLPSTLDLSQMDMNSNSSLMLDRGLPNFPHDTENDFGVSNFLEGLNMKRAHPNDADTPVSPNKKRSVGPRSVQDVSYGTQSSPGSQMLSRGLSSGGQSSQYFHPQAGQYNIESAQVQDHTPTWSSHNQQDAPPIEQEQLEQEASAEDKDKKQKKKHPCDLCIEKAFTTSNDLERHRRTVHSMVKPGEKVWLCNMGNCQAGRKVWARQDNFKQHITRMHQVKNSDIIERMSVNYDPNVHEMQVNKKRQASSLDAHRPVQSLTMSRQSNNSQGPRSHNLSPNSASRGNTSMQNHDDSLMTGSSLHNTRQCSRQRRPSHITSPNRQRLPRSAATIANPEMIADRQQYLQLESPFPQVYTEGSAKQDLSQMGGFSSSDLQGQTLPIELGIRRSSQPESSQPSTALNEHDFLQFFATLPAERQDRLCARISHMSGVHGQTSHTRQTRQRSAPNLKPQSVKKADSVKDEMTHICTEQGCSKKFAKPAELRKHEERHKRKYGCTFDGCFKKFGTKWEWKRHERSQHVQDTEWRCDVGIAGILCGQSFKSEDDFKSHLRAHHRMINPELQNRLKTCVLSKKWIGSFWCGFCMQIIHRPDLVGPDSYEARYSHIADHIDNKGQPCHINQWIEVGGGGKNKAEIKQSNDGAKLQSSTDSSASPTEQIDRDSSDCSGDDDDGQDEISIGASQQSVQVSLGQAMMAGPNQSQAEFPSQTTSPEIYVSQHFESQPGFADARFYDATQHGSQIGFDPHMYTNQFNSMCACGLCPSCTTNSMDQFFDTDRMDDQVLR